MITRRGKKTLTKNQRPLGRTVQLLSRLHEIGKMARISERVLYLICVRETSVLKVCKGKVLSVTERRFYSDYTMRENPSSLCVFPRSGVIPKARVFTSGTRDLPLICTIGFIDILPVSC